MKPVPHVISMSADQSATSSTRNPPETLEAGFLSAPHRLRDGYLAKVEIRFRDVSVRYRLEDGTLRDALRDVSLTVRPGGRVAVTGPNGSGKSTLALVMAGLLGVSDGEVTFGDDLSKSPSSPAALLFQDPDDNLIGDTALADVALSLEYANQTSERWVRAREILSRAGLSHLADRPLTQTSGGEKQSVALVSAMATGKPFLILDEPTSHLDPPSRRALLDRLVDHVDDLEPGSLRPAIVLITQYEEEAGRFPRVIALREGRIVHDGPPLPSSMPRRRVRRAGSDRVPPPGEAIVTVDNLSVPALPAEGKQGRLSGINVVIHRGESIALIGPMGAGKSTLAFSLTGIAGDNGNAVRWHIPQSRESAPALMIQFPERQLFCPTVHEEVTCGPKARGLGEVAVQTRAIASMQRAGLSPERDSGLSPFSLSGGQRRRVALAAIAACPAALYILDEPTASLDRDGIERVADSVRGWVSEGAAVILISHDLDWLRGLTSRLWVLKAGRLIYDGDWDDNPAASIALSDIGFL